MEFAWRLKICCCIYRTGWKWQVKMNLEFKNPFHAHRGWNNSTGGGYRGWGAEILSHLILAPYTSYQILAPQPTIASYAWISDYPFAKIMWGAKTYLAPLSRLKYRIRPWAPIMKFSNKAEFSSIERRRAARQRFKYTTKDICKAERQTWQTRSWHGRMVALVQSQDRQYSHHGSCIIIIIFFLPCAFLPEVFEHLPWSSCRNCNWLVLVWNCALI